MENSTFVQALERLNAARFRRAQCEEILDRLKNQIKPHETNLARAIEQEKAAYMDLVLLIKAFVENGR